MSFNDAELAVVLVMSFESSTILCAVEPGSKGLHGPGPWPDLARGPGLGLVAQIIFGFGLG